MYAILVGIFLSLLLTRGLSFYAFSVRASTKLHNTLFNRVIRAPMSFFSLTPLGGIINSFSKDQDFVDEGLPDTLQLTMIYFLILMTTVILVSVVLPLYALVIVLLLGSFVLFTLFYIKTAIRVKILVSNSAAPVMDLVSETLDGISVIRAFSAQAFFRYDCLLRLDRNHVAMFTQDQLQLWLAFHVDFIGALLVFLTALYCFLARNDIDSSAAGLAISNSIQKLIFFSWMVRGTADSLSLFNSVDRIYKYITNTSQEADQAVVPYLNQVDVTLSEAEQPKLILPNNWPNQGSIEFQDVVMSYLPTLPPALNGVSFKIQPGEKVGIVGRTGSGKSTTLICLFRLVEASQGKVFVDDIDVGLLNLQQLRASLAILPQEPVMFTGTIRYNIDPFYRHSDEELWKALELSHLSDWVRSLPNTIDTFLQASSVSLGQKQLVCLARAALNKSAILCLDEATAALDLATDALIQRTLETSDVFKHRTILTVAHRLDTIIKSDKILAMDAGRVVEFDTPYNLLQKPDSFFYQLVDQAGDRAQILRNIVFEREKARRELEQ